jgi:hypothetical protein
MCTSWNCQQTLGKVLFTLLIAVAILGLIGRLAMAEEPSEKQVPAVGIKYFYVYCNDIEAMRVFYSELLGMEEVAFNNDDKGAWLVYDCGGVELDIFPADGEIEVKQDWGAQPGWPGGMHYRPSWSVSVPMGQ